MFFPTAGFVYQCASAIVVEMRLRANVRYTSDSGALGTAGVDNRCVCTDSLVAAISNWTAKVANTRWSYLVFNQLRWSLF